MIARLLMACWLALLAAPGMAHEEHADSDAAVRQPLALSAAFDREGHLWRAYARAGQVLVDRSDDGARSFTPAVAVNPQPEKVGAEGELRPRIAIGPGGEIYVSWTEALAKPYAGDIKFSRSLDGGRHFSAPVVVNKNRDVITHRFDSLAVAGDGTVYVAWIDKRDLQQAQAAGGKYEGAAVYYAVSRDRGASFGAEFKVGDHSCECCRIGLETDADGNAVMLWRHVFDGVRDHAIARIGPQGVLHGPVRASFGGWRIDACPHHGPALARGGDWGWHMAWFDGGKPGLYYARMDGAAWVSSPAKRFGNPERQAGHPALLSVGERVYLAWKEIGEQDSAIWLAMSEDGGRNWNAPVEAAHSAGATDYAQLLQRDGRAWLVWNTADEGFRLLPLGAR